MLFIKAKTIIVVTIITTVAAAVPAVKLKYSAGEIRFPVSKTDLDSKFHQVRDPPLDPGLLGCPDGQEPIQVCNNGQCELRCKISCRFN